MTTFRSMVLRVAHSGVVLYANQAFCQYDGKPRKEIEGAALADVPKMTTGEVSECFTQIGEHLQPNALVTDMDGRFFEVKTARELGVLDIVLDEVTRGEELGEMLRQSSGTPVDDLDEDELRTLRHPDLRNVSICRARLQTDAKATGALTPWGQRILPNAFIEGTGFPPTKIHEEPLQNLRQLTISPELLQNPEDLSQLKTTAIAFIRSPEDPQNQSAADFFRKHPPSKQN